MKRLGLGLVRCGFGCSVLSLLVFGAATLSHGFGAQGFLAGMVIFIYLGCIPALLGGAIWAAGWIIEGFLAPGEPSE
jgi:hypothetical protein